MTKLRHLKATGFRGARFAFPVDFTKDHRSIAVFGENASGKSTITDALEWFITDRIDHLWREDCKAEALRHVLCGDEEPSVVEVSFEGKDRAGTKTLTPKLKSNTAYNSPEVGPLIERLQGDRIILRHAQIVEFLNDKKGEKRKVIASIIGYEEITKFRDVIQQTRNALQKEDEYTGAKQQSNRLQGRMIEIVGEIVKSDARFYEIVNDIIKPIKIETRIFDEETLQKTVLELRGLGSDPEKIKAAERLKQFEKACDDLKRDIEDVSTKADAFVGPYNLLAKERESVNKLRLSEFLTKGRDVLADGSFTDPQCPFCLSSYDLSVLQTEVAARIIALAELQKKLETSGQAKEALLQAVTTAGQTANTLIQTYAELEEFSEFIAAATAARNALRSYYAATKSAFERLQAFTDPEGFAPAIAQLLKRLEEATGQAQQAATRLDLSEREKLVAAALDKLQQLRRDMADYAECQRTVKSFEDQIMTLTSLFDDFVAVQNTVLQAVLDRISKDVGQFYKILHPKENVDEVRLSMVGEEGVEFEYLFHKRKTYPPHKYLSESHLNSLGVVLFLANARIFNKEARFVILDDIVTSFDFKHRRRLLRLIKEEFADWQVIILTHENMWFELIKREMKEQGWLFREVQSDPTNGISLDESPATLRAIIVQKRGKDDVTNDLRKLLEATLKEICLRLEVKLVFRLNEYNERRMPEEMLSQIRGMLKEKSPDLANNKIFSDLAGSILVANIGSHDNPERIVGGDIDVVLDDIESLASLFVCESCQRFVQASAHVPGSKAIACRCGKKQIPWKR